MEKQRLLKVDETVRRLMVKALDHAQKDARPQQAAVIQGLMEKTVQAPKGKLYLNEEEFQTAKLALNEMRNVYLAQGRSSGGFDRVLFMLIKSRYRRAPALAR